MISLSGLNWLMRGVWCRNGGTSFPSPLECMCVLIEKCMNDEIDISRFDKSVCSQ